MGLGALSIVLGVFGDLGSLLIAATLIPITFFMHAFWKETDAQAAKQADQIAFNKNVGPTGGALALFLLFSVTVRTLASRSRTSLFNLS